MLVLEMPDIERTVSDRAPISAPARAGARVATVAQMGLVCSAGQIGPISPGHTLGEDQCAKSIASSCRWMNIYGLGRTGLPAERSRASSSSPPDPNGHLCGCAESSGLRLSAPPAQ